MTDTSNQTVGFRCYRCGESLTYVQHPGHHTLDCPKCGPDQRAVEIVEEDE